MIMYYVLLPYLITCLGTVHKSHFFSSSFNMSVWYFPLTVAHANRVTRLIDENVICHMLYNHPLPNRPLVLSWWPIALYGQPQFIFLSPNLDLTFGNLILTIDLITWFHDSPFRSLTVKIWNIQPTTHGKHYFKRKSVMLQSTFLFDLLLVYFENGIKDTIIQTILVWSSE